MAFVTLKGINDAISNLALRPGTLQERLLSILLSYFSTEESLKEITSISSDELVHILWDVASQEEIRKKKKNLSSLKSAINKRFKELTAHDQNPEGLIIGKDNVFTISEEHKNSLLTKLGITSGSDSAMDLLASMRGLLGELTEGVDSSQLQAMLSELDKTKEIIDRLIHEKGEGADASGEEGGSESSPDVEEIELGEDEEIVVVQGQQGGRTEAGPETGEDSGGAAEGLESKKFESEGLYSDITEDEELVEELLDEEELIAEEIIEEEVEEDESAELFGEPAGTGSDSIAGQGQGGDATELGDLTVGTGQFDDSIGPDAEEQDLKILDDEDVIEELLEEDIEEHIDEDETIEVEDEEIIEVEDDVDLAGAGSEEHQLDLSRYIESSEALENLPDTLEESNDELISMIMQRFMPPFIQIPAGNYRVGCKKPKSIDRQEQSVILKRYHISQIPVTNDIFDFFIRETGYETDAEKKGYGTVVEGRFSQKTDPDTGKASLIINPGVRFQHVEGANWRHPKGPHSSLENKASHPVVQISRRDAIAFAAWAGKKLPSEDEWEAAARGSAGLLFPWGDEWLDTYGNFESSQIGDTTPVTHFGKVSMSAFGLLDMLGNVLEWTSSRHLDAGDKGNAPRLSILKGGSWATGGIITAATRFLEGDDTWSNIIGFRCAV